MWPNQIIRENLSPFSFFFELSKLEKAIKYFELYLGTSLLFWMIFGVIIHNQRNSMMMLIGQSLRHLINSIFQI